MKRVFLHFLGGPWDGGTIEAPHSPWTPPLKLWVYVLFRPINGMPFIEPDFWDLKMYPAQGTSGPYVAKILRSQTDSNEFLFQLQKPTKLKKKTSPS